jgi:predicted transcriptional regulator YheO
MANPRKTSSRTTIARRSSAPAKVGSGTARAEGTSEAQARAERALLLREAKKIVQALGKSLAPFCEVVLHDLTRPNAAVVAIENPLSNRRIGDAATQLGLARISDAGMPDQIVNYTNRLSDGRPLKSTSIGLRDSQGTFIAAICLNFDVGFFSDVMTYFREFTRSTPLTLGIKEFSDPKRPSIEDAVRQFAVKRNVQPRGLSADQRRELIAELQQSGMLELKGAPSRVAALLGVSRTALYHYVDRHGSLQSG